ncbi:MAG: hypothetical protein IKI83_00270 [Prevotella sp.]|nr:hypothetical protein [Prevotella sp.]
MKAIKLFLSAILLLSVSQIQADNFSADEFTIAAGEKKTININLTNSRTIYGFQFSLYLPTGVSITTRTSGAYKITGNSNRLFNWTVASNFDSEKGCYIIGAGGLDAIEETSGAILSIEITASDQIDTRENKVYIKQQKITINKANGDPVTIDADETITESPCTLQINAKIGSSGYCSFSWPRALDFSNCQNCENVFIAKDQGNNYVKISSLNNKLVPANTGVLIKGTPGDVVHPQTTDNEGTIDNNLFIPTSEGTFTVPKKGDAWALAVKSGKTGFYPCEAGVVIPQYKCYLPASVSAKSFIMIKQENPDEDLVSEDAGIIDGINTVNGNDAQDTYYDLQGRRVSTARHGIYIQNNKKVIIK